LARDRVQVGPGKAFEDDVGIDRPCLDELGDEAEVFLAEGSERGPRQVLPLRNPRSDAGAG
jgi:hypothetical protein